VIEPGIQDLGSLVIWLRSQQLLFLLNPPKDQAKVPSAKKRQSSRVTLSTGDHHDESHPMLPAHLAHERANNSLPRVLLLVSVYVTDTTNLVLDIDGYFTPVSLSWERR
jgi:hypothetical protein